MFILSCNLDTTVSFRAEIFASVFKGLKTHTAIMMLVCQARLMCSRCVFTL